MDASIDLDEDGSVVVQGDFLGLVGADGKIRPSTTAAGEARVRIPADLLRRAVLGSVTAYKVQAGGEALMLDPAGVRVAFSDGLGG